MPIGVMLCFGPALVVYWLTESRSGIPNDPVSQPNPVKQKKS